MNRKLNAGSTLSGKETAIRSTTEKVSLITVWLMSIMIPLVYLPGSHNPVLVKLLVFTALSGLLLALAGLHVLKGRAEGPFHIVPVALVVGLTAFHLYAPSVYGVTRILLVASGSAVFLSAGVFRFKPRLILLPLLCGGVFALLISFVVPNSTHRLSGTFLNANLIASYAAGIIPLGVCMLRGKGWKGALLQAALIALCVTVIHSSGTRAGIIALPAGTAVALLLRWRRKLLFPLALVYMTAVFATLFQNVIRAPELEGSAGARQVIWQGSREMFMRKPLFGWGTGSFHLVFSGFRPGDYARRGLPPNVAHAHSEPIELLTENGIAGFIVCIVVLNLLFRRAFRGRKGTAEEWGVVAALAVVLIEGLVSVAFRWTTTFFLFTLLLSSMQGFSGAGIRRIPGWAGFIPLFAGLTLAVTGSNTACGMIRSILLYDSAVNAHRDGKPSEVSRDLCLRSLEYNSWTLESWFLLGNLHVLDAFSTEEPARQEEHLRKGLAVYDSLESRARNYDRIAINRTLPLMRLGMWNEAIDDMMRVYLYHNHLKRFAVDSGTALCPLADPDKSLEFANLIYSSILGFSLRNPASEDETDTNRMLNALGVTYALAANHAPDAVPGMRETTDSLLGQAGNRIVEEVGMALENELQLASEGYRLQQELSAGRREGLEELCISALNTPGVYAPYHRWILSALSVEEGRGRHLNTARELAFLLNDTCYPLAELFPGAGRIFAVAASISPGKEGEILRESFLRVIEMDCYGGRVMDIAANSLEGLPPSAPEFWWNNGGPAASITLFSPGGDLIPGGQLERILGEMPSSPAYLNVRLSALFITGSIALSVPGAELRTIMEMYRDRFVGLRDEFVQRYGEEQAVRLITRVFGEDMTYLEGGPFHRSVVTSARSLKGFLTEDDPLWSN